MANSSKKPRGTKSKSRKKSAVKAVHETPVTDLSYGGTESDAVAPAIPECVDVLPEAPIHDVTEQTPAVMMDVLPDETVQPSAPKVAAAPVSRGVGRWLGKLVAWICGVR